MKKILLLTISLFVLGLPMGAWGGRPPVEEVEEPCPFPGPDGCPVVEPCPWVDMQHDEFGHCACPTGTHEEANGCIADDNGEEEPGEEPEQPQAQAATNVPALEHFTGSNTYTADELNFTFTPKGSAPFVLHVNLKSVGGRDVLSGWCTGDEGICKAVGNGKACSGEDYTGSNMWCYKAE